MLTVPLAGRTQGLGLRAVTTDGPGKRFEPTPGPHVIRVRPGRSALDAEQPPVSNAVTVTFRTPFRPDTSGQSVVLTTSVKSS